MNSKKIINFLEKRKVSFDIIEHKEVFTAKDAAKATKVAEKEIAKVLIIKVNGKKFIMAVLSANLAAKLKRIKAFLKAKEVVLATEAEMKRVTGLKPGSAPALGKLLKIPVILDKKAKNNKNIVFPAGEYTKSIKVEMSQWLELEKPEIVDFSVIPSEKKKSSKKK